MTRLSSSSKTQFWMSTYRHFAHLMPPSVSPNRFHWYATCPKCLQEGSKLFCRVPESLAPARVFARFVVMLACISSALWTEPTETTIAQTPGSEEPEYGIATPLALPGRRARGECVVLILRHFVPILSTQVLVSSVVLHH